MKPVDDKAIAVGVAIGVAIGLLGTALGWLLPMLGDPLPVGVLIWFFRLFSIGGKAAGGFVGGWLARRDGALHGAIVGAAVAAIGFGIGMVMTVSRSGTEIYSRLGPDYWITLIAWSAAGILVAAIAGHVAVQMRARKM